MKVSYTVLIVLSTRQEVRLTKTNSLRYTSNASRSARKKLSIEQAATVTTLAPTTGRLKRPTKTLINSKLPASETTPVVTLNFASRRRVFLFVGEGLSFQVQR